MSMNTPRDSSQWVPHTENVTVPSWQQTMFVNSPSGAHSDWQNTMDVSRSAPREVTVTMCSRHGINVSIQHEACFVTFAKAWWALPFRRVATSVPLLVVRVRGSKIGLRRRARAASLSSPPTRNTSYLTRSSLTHPLFALLPQPRGAASRYGTAQERGGTVWGSQPRDVLLLLLLDAIYVFEFCWRGGVLGPRG